MDQLCDGQYVRTCGSDGAWHACYEHRSAGILGCTLQIEIHGPSESVVACRSELYLVLLHVKASCDGRLVLLACDRRRFVEWTARSGDSRAGIDGRDGRVASIARRERNGRLTEIPCPCIGT